jgi:putative effector of murein hydrolase LrgA (UPF0299 family)
MNRFMFIGSLVGVFLFSLLLLLTIVGQQHLKDFARDYLNRRIEPSITKGVAAIEREVLPKLTAQPEIALQITSEISAYRADPLRYIDQVTSGKATPQAEGWMAKASAALQASAKKSVSLPQMIGDHFRRVFENLLLDLRIFAISNIIGYAVVALLTHGLSEQSRRLQIQAFILFLATGYALSVYIKQDWFFNLLLDHHMGLIYPFLILVTCFDLWRRWRSGRLRRGATRLVREIALG